MDVTVMVVVSLIIGYGLIALVAYLIDREDD